jgi:hypothetical protein
MGSLFSSPEQPKPINIQKTAKTALDYNKKNAWQQHNFNRLNQTDAFGNTLNYTQTGKDSRGNPIFNVQQQLGETGQGFADQFKDLGMSYFSKAQDLINNPADYTNETVESRLYDLGSRRLDPRFRNEQAALESQLANMGMDRSSEAWSNEMKRFTEGKNDAYNQLLFQGRDQAFNEAYQGRNQQVSELQGLTQPGLQFGVGTTGVNAVNSPQVNGGNVDIMGLTGMNQAQQNANYQAQVQNQNGMLGGLASIGGSLAMAPVTGGGSLFGNAANKYMFGA